MHAADVVIDITEVDSSPMYPLGQEFYAPATSQASVTTSKPPANSGPRVWVYVFNDEDSGADFAAGDIIIRDAATTTYDGLIAGSGTLYPAMRVMGVAQHAIADGSYGWILKKGFGLVKCGDANISANAAITSGGDAVGCAIDFADGAEECVFGLALEAETTDDTTFDAWINCPG
tara:strand:- start:822 stop:1346 length:525 start_codon:yes stop_codon:yes gene_type:complete